MRRTGGVNAHRDGGVVGARGVVPGGTVRSQQEASMRNHSWVNIAVAAALGAAATVAGAEVTATTTAANPQDGLVRSGSRQFDELYLQPGAESRRYTKVMIEPVEAAFTANWRRDLNAQRIALLTRTTEEDAERILLAARSELRKSFARAFVRAGYEVVSAPAADVMVVTLRVSELSVNAPSSVTMAVPSRVYTYDAGRVTLHAEARDAITGVPLERVVDRRTAYNAGPFAKPAITDPVTNRFEFGRVFDAWARDFVASRGEPVSSPAD